MLKPRSTARIVAGPADGCHPVSRESWTKAGKGVTLLFVAGRGGLSKDPEARKRQLAVLEAGRKIASERRAAGLPTKRRESRDSAGDGGQTTKAGTSATVRRGGYGGARRGTTQDDGRRKRERQTSSGGDAPTLNVFERVYAAVLGYPTA